MGELSHFLIDELTPEQEDAFYRILDETCVPNLRRVEEPRDDWRNGRSRQPVTSG